MNAVELLTTVSVISVLLAIFVPTIIKARAVSDKVNCLSNLRQIAFGFSLYATDNGNKLPCPDMVGTPWENSLHRYLPSPRLFLCLSDQEVGPNIGSSYDWRDTGIPETTLAGRSPQGFYRSGVVLVFETLPDWHRKGHVNAGWLDGSVHELEDDEFFNDLDTPIDRKSTPSK